MKLSSGRFSLFLFPRKFAALQQLVNRNLLAHHSLPTSSAKFSTNDSESESHCAFLSHNELYRKLIECREELRRHKIGTPEHDLIKQRIGKLDDEILRLEELRYKLSSDEKEKMSFSSMLLTPTNVTLEVISNGTTHLRPSVMIRTAGRYYIFNCPEGISRFLPILRVRVNSINDIFTTKANWENTGGIASLLLEKTSSSEDLRLHGPPHIKTFLETQRPFLDADFGHVNYPVHLEEWTYEKEQFEDSILHVRYIPLSGHRSSSPPSPSLSPTSSLSSTTDPSSSIPAQTNYNDDKKAKKFDLAYLVQIKEAPPNIDPIKLMKLKIPKGPHIAKLKAGSPITLEDGRVIQPTDVYSDAAIVRLPNLLFVELVSGEKLSCIHSSKLLKDFMGLDRAHQMNYIVHFTRPSLVNSADYRVWMRSFGPKCRHLMVNGTGSPMTLNDGIYRAQQQLNDIFPQAFPQIYPPSDQYEGKVFTQNIDCDDSLADQPPTEDGIGPIFFGSLFQRFPVRGPLPKMAKDDPSAMKIDFSIKELDVRTHSLPELPAKLRQFKKALGTALGARRLLDPYPQVIFLGTASAVASKYRNVSSHLLQLSPSSTVMIDCGEGTYGQMRAMFGPELCAQLLTNLNALFITHAHLDHTNGLYTIVQERIKAFGELGLPYRQLVLVSNHFTRKTITATYAHCYQNIDRFLKYVDAPFLHQQATVGINQKAVHGLPSLGAVTEFTDRFPNPLFCPKEWNLRSVKGVQVLHTRSSTGYVFECADSGRRVVFSGDTKPCELLEQHGRDADVLIHECTFEDGMEHDAFYKRHSTMRQAFDSAQRMRAKFVLLTHFSTRYARVPPLPDYLLNAEIFSVANDNMIVPFDLRHLFPKLLPLYRELFKEELFENQIKKMKRRLENREEELQQPNHQHQRKVSIQR